MDDRPRPRARMPLLQAVFTTVFVGAAVARHLLRKPTAEDLAAARESRRRRAEREAALDRKLAQASRARSLAVDYFNKGHEGGRRLEEATITTIVVGPPFADAKQGRSRSSVSSAEAKAELSINWDVRDGAGTLRLTCDSGTELQRTFYPEFDKGYRLSLTGDELEMFKLAARLVVSTYHDVVALRVCRPDWKAVRERLWVEHLERNPALAEEIGWTGTGPFSYL